MEKRYIEALSNFSIALEHLVDEMAKQASDPKKSDGYSGNTIVTIEASIERIDNKLANISQQNKEILSNQKTILNVAKEKDTTGGLFSISDKGKSDIGKGAANMVLMAGSILAIGLAFGIVGDVDFASVLALSIALPLVATAFIVVATMVKQHKLSIKDMAMAGLAMVMVSSAITGSSWILSSMSNMSPWQTLTAVMIGLVFGVLMNGLSIKLGFLEVKFGGLGDVLRKISKIKMKAVFMLPIFMVAVATALTLSSYILSSATAIDIGLLGSLAVQGIALGVVATAMALPMRLLGKMGLKNVLMGSIAIVAVAGAVALSSHLLAMGDYSNYPGLEWGSGVGLTMIAFTAPIVALGIIAMTGVGALAILAGAGMMLIVAGTIVGVSNVLNSGDYSIGSDLGSWASSVALLYLTFTPIMVALGALGIVGTVMEFFGADNPFETAKKMMVQIAETIVDVSHILSQGNFSGGPDPKWALGIRLSLLAFMPLIRDFQLMNVLSLFGGKKPDVNMYADIIRTVSHAILVAGDTFAKAPARWVNGPTEAWAKGVGLSIQSFMPVVEYALSSPITDFIFGSTTDNIKKVITTVAEAIIDAAEIFAKNPGNYKNGPSEDWATGVGIAVKSFTELYTWVYDGVNWTPQDITNADAVIRKVIDSIKFTSTMFTDGDDWSNYPSSDWTDNVITTINGFIGLYEWVYDGVDWTVADVVNSDAVIKKVIETIKSSSLSMQGVSNTKVDVKDMVNGIKQWLKLSEEVNDMDIPVKGIIKIHMMAKAFNKLAWSMNNLSQSIKKFDPRFLQILGEFSGVNLKVERPGGNAWDVINPFGKTESGSNNLISGGSGASAEVTKLNKSNDKNHKEVIKELQKMTTELGKISSNTGTMSGYLDQIRKKKPEPVKSK